MRFSIAAGAVALCGSAIAVPAPDAPKPTPPPVLVGRDGDDRTWVSVIVGGQDRQLTTMTPHVTTINGNVTTENPIPYSLTGTVYTYLSYAKSITSTGPPPNPTANGDGTGAYFERCHNLTGPICKPSPDHALELGHTYIVTWDPDYDFFKSGADLPPANDTSATNGTAKPTINDIKIGVRLQAWNTTKKAWDPVSSTDSKYNVTSGFALINSKDFEQANKLGQNVSIVLAAFRGTNTVDGAQVGAVVPLMVTAASLPPPPKGALPSGAALYIGLPVAFGAIVLIVIGGCIWNRKTRRIELGKLVGRKRGYSGRGARRRMFNADDHGDIQLHNNDTPAYRDVPGDVLHDSDNFHETGTTGGRNAFRDEVARQNNERRGEF